MLVIKHRQVADEIVSAKMPKETADYLTEQARMYGVSRSALVRELAHAFHMGLMPVRVVGGPVGEVLDE